MDFETWARALAKTESNEDSRAWGDEGLACGKWQQHPAFTLEWIRLSQVKVRSSWNDIFYHALENFFHHYQDVMPYQVKLAMMFHLGVDAVNQGQWDAEYEKRFLDALEEVSATSASGKK
jgi:hypothetical protein